MANEEHLKILRQGVRAWGDWRNRNSDQRPNLRDANLTGADLTGAYLFDADLAGANLRGANLTGVNLRGANLTGAFLKGANLSHTWIGNTNLTNIDLSEVKGLSSITHFGPSSIGVDTLYKSGGNISEEFLRGCGVPENLITYLASLTGKAFDYYSCFISYSSKDQTFAERLYADLQSKGVRCWYAPEDLKIGDRFRDRIEETIRIYDKVMIVVSENSISSRWVEREVNAALEREDTRNQTVLFPIRLDEAIMESQKPWAAELRRARHIGNFRNWQDYTLYRAAFERLLRDLRAEEVGGGE